MKRRILLAVGVLVFILTFGVQSALADDAPPACPSQPCVYVDPYRNPAGNEDGTQTNPYNTQTEGIGFARARTNGAYIIVKNQNGTWSQPDYEPGATSGGGGIPFPKATLYLIVAAVALSLTVAGWILQRKSQLLVR